MSTTEEKEILEFEKILQKIIFLKSFSNTKAWKLESNFPEFAFIGRSNSGKSSLINAVTGRKSLAKTSRTPGKTRLINIFAVPNLFCLVDLPGYGFSKASHKEHKEMMELLDSYLNQSHKLAHLFILLDSRREIPEEERGLIQTAIRRNIPVSLIRTKSDKLNQSERVAAKKENKEFESNSIFTSVLSGEGILEIREILRKGIE